MVSKPKVQKNRGFSLVEMIVAVGIFTLITSVVLFNHGKFSSNLIVTNLAYEVALAVRQAQVYGISVKEVKGATGNFNSAYGVHFDKDDLQAFVIFADKNSNFQYDADEVEEIVTFKGSNTIDKFCVVMSSGDACSPSDLPSLDIMFKRPETNAQFYVGGERWGTVIQAEVQVTTTRADKTARLTVSSTGQISVDACTNNTARPCK